QPFADGAGAFSSALGDAADARQQAKMGAAAVFAGAARGKANARRIQWKSAGYTAHRSGCGDLYGNTARRPGNQSTDQAQSQGISIRDLGRTFAERQKAF